MTDVSVRKVEQYVSGVLEIVHVDETRSTLTGINNWKAVFDRNSQTHAVLDNKDGKEWIAFLKQLMFFGRSRWICGTDAQAANLHVEVTYSDNTPALPHVEDLTVEADDGNVRYFLAPTDTRPVTSFRVFYDDGDAYIGDVIEIYDGSIDLYEPTTVMVTAEVDVVSFERGGDDSVSADLNGQDTLDSGLQKTLTALISSTSLMDSRERALVWSLLTSSKMFAENDTGGVQILQVDDDGNLKVTGVDIDVDLTSVERGGDDTVSADTNGNDVLASGDQKTIAAWLASRGAIAAGDLANLWGLFVHSKLWGMNDDGDMVPLKADDNRVLRTIDYITGVDKTYEDPTFNIGDPAAVCDVNNDLGRNAHKGFIICDGAGDIQIEIADSSGYGAIHTMKNREVFTLDGYDIDTIRVTNLGANSAYRISVL